MMPFCQAAHVMVRQWNMNGNPVAFAVRMIQGVTYALFQVAPGAYQGTYTP
jgi:hypothetical protein